jgi:hypothetical protein
MAPTYQLVMFLFGARSSLGWPHKGKQGQLRKL